LAIIKQLTSGRPENIIKVLSLHIRYRIEVGNHIVIARSLVGLADCDANRCC
jgi:hypothetical protein